MTTILFGILIGVLIAFLIVLYLYVRAKKQSVSKSEPNVQVHMSIEDIKSIGQLSALKVVTKEIVTAKDHWLGDLGRKYFEWLTSSKKMAMIFDFDINFSYDLRDSDCTIEPDGVSSYILTLPRCTYELHIRDITFYDEQHAKFLPWLVPDFLNSIFGSGFTEEDRNKLKQEARKQAEALALNLVTNLRSEVQSSARETLSTLAKGFGADKVTIHFMDATPKQTKVEYVEEDLKLETGN